MVCPGSILYYSGGAGGSRLMYVYYSKSLPLEILRTTTRTVPRVHVQRVAIWPTLLVRSLGVYINI